MKSVALFAVSLILFGGSLVAFASPAKPDISATDKDAANAKRQEILACKKVAKESYQSKLVNIEKIRKDFTKTQQQKMSEATKAAQVVYRAAVKKAQDDLAVAKKAARATYNSALDTAKTTMKSNRDEYKKEYNTAAAGCEAK